MRGQAEYTMPPGKRDEKIARPQSVGFPAELEGRATGSGARSHS